MCVGGDGWVTLGVCAGGGSLMWGVVVAGLAERARNV